MARLLLSLPLLSLYLLFAAATAAAAAAGQSGGVCVSPGGRFPSFSFEGKPPKKAVKGPRDLTLCRVFRQNTCCDVTQTYPTFLLIRRLASVGEANQECLDFWELLECSICDPRVGVQPGPPLICSSLCDQVLQACGNAYFSSDPKSHVLTPCGSNDILCGRLNDWASNGTELCRLAGFRVQPDGISHKGTDEPVCYGGKASLDSIADSWKASQFSSSNSEKFDVEDFRQWVREMPFSEKVAWAVGGMVLTAGLWFMSKRKSYNQRQKQAAIYRAARRLEAKGKLQPPDSFHSMKTTMFTLRMTATKQALTERTVAEDSKCSKPARPSNQLSFLSWSIYRARSAIYDRYKLVLLQQLTLISVLRLSQNPHM